MGTITIKPELMAFENKKGTRQIYIRITEDKKHIRKKIGISVKTSEWDVSNGRVKKTNPNYKSYNSRIVIEIAKYEKQYEKLKEEDKPVSKTDVFQSVNKVILKQDFIKFWDIAMSEMDNYNNEKTFATTKNKIIEFMGEKPFDFSIINETWLNSFDKVLKTENLSVTTRHIHFKKIRRAWNLGIKAKVVSKELYPFGQEGFKLPSVANVEKELERLEIHEIQSIFKCQYDNESVYDEGINLKFYSQRAFLVAFLCAGIRVEDLLTLKWNNIKHGSLSYCMKKGVAVGKLKTFGIDSELDGLLESLRKPDSKPTDYIFPFLPNDTIEDTGKYYKSLISSKTSIYNKNLKLIATDIGCSKNITSHVARHSWAAITYEATKDIKFIQENLDHEKIETTIRYIGRLTTKQNDEKLQTIYSSIFGNNHTKIKEVT